MRKLVYSMAVAMMSAALVSCDGNNTTGASTLTASSDNVTTTSASAGEAEKVSKISFEDAEHDFGKVVSGEVVKHTYKFTNTGSTPLILQNVSASCGCTVPNKWPKEPIAPGQTGEIDVEFDSKGRIGQQNKTVTIQANTQPGNTVLVLRGIVLDDSRGPVNQ